MHIPSDISYLIQDKLYKKTNKSQENKYMKTDKFSEAFKRLEPLGIKTQQQLAKALGITQSAVADAKRRGSFPKGWAVDLSQAYGVSVDDILVGGGKEIISSNVGKTVNEEEQMYRLKFEEAQVKIIELQDEIARLQKNIIESQTQKKARVTKKAQ